MNRLFLFRHPAHLPPVVARAMVSAIAIIFWRFITPITQGMVLAVVPIPFLPDERTAHIMLQVYARQPSIPIRTGIYPPFVRWIRSLALSLAL